MSYLSPNHLFYMEIAYQQAVLGYEQGEIPVGAVVVCQNKVIAKAHNQTEKLKDATAHAEILAITAASEHLGAKYLTSCSLYVTLEPCVMCAGALAWAQVGTVVYAARDSKKGFSVYSTDIFHSKIQVIQGVMQQECSELLQKFFRELRGN
jgi:tRNA(adenine34) deaminase